MQRVRAMKRAFLLAVPVLLVTAAACSSGEKTCHDTGQALTVCPTKSTVKGLDVSYYQSTIDWTKVKAAGYGFAIARVSDGTGFSDPKFAANWQGMKSVGMIRGVYQFFRASQDPIAQADLLVDAVQKLGQDPTDIPPVADVEVSDGVSSTTLRTNLQKWLDRVEKRMGRKPVIYTGPSFGSSVIGNGFSAYPLWVANWGVSCPAMPADWKGWKFWQNADNGQVSGISGGVDTDEWNGTLQDLKDWTDPPKPPTDGGAGDAAAPPSPSPDSGAPSPSPTTPTPPGAQPGATDPCAP